MLALLAVVALARPPNQTKVQASVLHNHEGKAKICSDNAKQELLNAINDPGFRQATAHVPLIAHSNATALLEMLYNEIHYAIMVHNGFGGATLDQVIGLRYLPSGWEAACEGFTQGGGSGQDVKEVAMGFPPMAQPPAKPQCYDRFIYMGLNLWKQSGGQHQFGGVAFTLDTYNDSSVFISPVDTGATAPDQVAQICFGTRTHFYHLVLPHLKFVGSNLAALFLRWYGKGPIPGDEHRFFEAEFAAAFYLPERLLMFLVTFDLFNDDVYKKLGQWARDMKRPLAWTDPNNVGGTLLDAWVGGITGVYNVTAKDKQLIQDMHVKKPDFNTFRAAITPHLQLHFLGHFNHHFCDPKKLHGCHFLGVNHEDQCLYWKH